VSTVIGARFSDAERAQVSRAAVNSKLTLSAFVREAALASSAVVVGKVSVQASEPSVRESLGVVLLDPEEGSHAFVDGICKRCGVDVDGRESPCTARS
jgi:uncharacterized protein (DUF1778 family)